MSLRLLGSNWFPHFMAFTFLCYVIYLLFHCLFLLFRFFGFFLLLFFFGGGRLLSCLGRYCRNLYCSYSRHGGILTRGASDINIICNSTSRTYLFVSECLLVTNINCVFFGKLYCMLTQLYVLFFCPY